MAIVEVRAELAGTVFSIVASPGSSVAEGDDLLVLESMKMEIPVAAPASGRVEAILVAEGEVVAEGAILARIAT